MIQEILEKYGVFVLVLAYLIINVYLRNLKVLVLFLVTFVGFYQTVTNKTYALVIAYLVSISFSIVKNFHLLENFKGVPKIPSSFAELNGTLNGTLNGKKAPLNGKLNGLKQVDESKITAEKVETPQPYNSIKAKKGKVKRNRNRPPVEIRDDHLYDPNKDNLEIQEILSDKLVSEFLEKLKKEKHVKVKNKKMSFYKLKPVIAELDGDTVNSLKNEIMYEANNLLKKNVVVSRDNYIIDGHYTWYLKGVFLSEKDEDTMIDSKYTDSLNVIQIDLDVDELIQKMKNYKFSYNANLLSKFSMDKNKMDALAENIKTLKKSVEKLEEHYVDLSNVNLV